ncbi:MAG: DinB family protein [FCB group bacterium]|jgi:uncharacterized damage-inducible protein DinB
MFRTINDFIQDWEVESDAMLKILLATTNGALLQKVYPEGRTLGDIAWHIVVSLGEMSATSGLNAVTPIEDTETPAEIQYIVDNFNKASNNLLDEVIKKWNDSMLLDDIMMYGEKWKRGFLLESVIRHQIHHRGQMTILMRQAHLKVPGVYGPSKEEWAQFGMQPAK